MLKVSRAAKNQFSGSGEQLETSALSARVALGSRIRVARESIKLSRSAAAALLNVSVSTFQAWENGEREPSVTQLSFFADTYNLSLTQLATGNGEETSASCGKIDAKKLSEIIYAVDTALTERGKKLPPPKKAQLITLIYEQTLEADSKKEVDELLERLLLLTM
jgi:DNA-binding transcriptional regulator YiaG